MASSVPLRVSLARARDTARPVMTSALSLGLSKRPEGVALVAAVYGPDPLPSTLLPRRAALRGYVGGIFSISYLARSALALLPAGSRLEIVSPTARVFSSRAGAMPDAIGAARVTGSDWTVRVALNQPQPLFALPALLLVGGSLAVALLVGVLFAQSNLRRREREEVHGLLMQEADTDGLTGLYNRRRLERDLETAIATATERDPLALMLLDLNGFKGYNDRFGHPAGDALLVRISARLVAAVPGAGVYRLGGDEFCLLAPLAPAALKTAVAAARDALTQTRGGLPDLGRLRRGAHPARRADGRGGDARRRRPHVRPQDPGPSVGGQPERRTCWCRRSPSARPGSATTSAASRTSRIASPAAWGSTTRSAAGCGARRCSTTSARSPSRTRS